MRVITSNDPTRFENTSEQLTNANTATTANGSQRALSTGPRKRWATFHTLRPAACNTIIARTSCGTNLLENAVAGHPGAGSSSGGGGGGSSSSSTLWGREAAAAAKGPFVIIKAATLLALHGLLKFSIFVHKINRKTVSLVYPLRFFDEHVSGCKILLRKTTEPAAPAFAPFLRCNFAQNEHFLFFSRRSSVATIFLSETQCGYHNQHSSAIRLHTRYNAKQLEFID
jgi:hypothetical protein